MTFLTFVASFSTDRSTVRFLFFITHLADKFGVFFYIPVLIPVDYSQSKQSKIHVPPWYRFFVHGIIESHLISLIHTSFVLVVINNNSWFYCLMATNSSSVTIISCVYHRCFVCYGKNENIALIFPFDGKEVFFACAGPLCSSDWLWMLLAWIFMIS